MGYKEEFIEFMVRSGVLIFGDFTTKSGRKTPYFINTGNYRTGGQAAMLGKYYAACLHENVGENVDVLYGPAYKGIPLAVSTVVSLYDDYNMDVAYCFNRKEAKDHGEGGVLIGHTPSETDRIVIIEDVITAGTAIRESMSILRAITNANVTSMIISADRMERGTGTKTAVQEVRDEFGIQVYPIVTILEIIDHLYNRDVDGKVYIDKAMKERMEQYLEAYHA